MYISTCVHMYVHVDMNNMHMHMYQNMHIYTSPYICI